MKERTRRLCIGGIVGALYAALTLILAPISYGAVQCRVSEALCAAAYFVPEAAWGVFLGCAIANIFSGSVFDVVFGSAATLIAALIIAALGKRPHTVGRRVLACTAPVAVNAVIVGAVICRTYEGMNIFAHPGVYAVNALWVALGEAAAMYAVALPLMFAVEKFFPVSS